MKQHLFFFFFLRQYLIVVIICILLLNNSVDHLYIFGEISFQVFKDKTVWVFLFLLLSYKNSFYQIYACIYFLPFSTLSFPSVDYFLCHTEALQFDVVSLVNVCIYVYAFSVISNKSLPRVMSRRFLHIFSSKNFIVSCPMFKTLVHFELIFPPLYVLGTHQKSVDHICTG